MGVVRLSILMDTHEPLDHSIFISEKCWIQMHVNIHFRNYRLTQINVYLIIFDENDSPMLKFEKATQATCRHAGVVRKLNNCFTNMWQKWKIKSTGGHSEVHPHLKN